MYYTQIYKLRMLIGEALYRPDSLNSSLSVEEVTER